MGILDDVVGKVKEAVGGGPRGAFGPGERDPRVAVMKKVTTREVVTF